MKNFAMLAVIIALVFSFFSQQSGKPSSNDEFETVAAYIREYGKLPENYITKNQAIKLGWDARAGNLWDVAEGMLIGGDRFYNRDGKLPDKKGRLWYEADIGYKGGHRGAKRIVFSNDGLIYKTRNHYKNFEEIK